MQKKFTPGTAAELKLNNQQYKTDLSFQGLVPQYKSELVLALTQPLLKDFGIDIGTSRIRIANLNQQMSVGTVSRCGTEYALPHRTLLLEPLLSK